MVRGYTHTTLDGSRVRSTLYPMLEIGQALRLVRDPASLFDPNAILVYPAEGRLRDSDLGHIPRERAESLAPMLDSGKQFECKVARIAPSVQDGKFVQLYVQLTEVEATAGETREQANERQKARESQAAQTAIHKTFSEDVNATLASLKGERPAEAAQRLIALLETVEAHAAATGTGVASSCYLKLAMLYRRQRKYGNEVQTLERYEQQTGSTNHKLAHRLEHARALKEDGGYGASYRRLKAKRAGSSEVVVETTLGSVKIDNRRHRAVALIALGRSEEHLKWFYDVHRREILERAVVNLNGFMRGKKDRSKWTDSYFDFIQTAPQQLADLPRVRKDALAENRSQIALGQVQVVGMYDSIAQATEAAKWSAPEFQPTPLAGWLNMQVIAIPQDIGEAQSAESQS